MANQIQKNKIILLWVIELTIWIKYYYSILASQMSFLQLISKTKRQKSINPVYQLLNHQRIPNMTSHKSQPKEIISPQPQQPLIGIRGLNNRAISVNQKQFKRTQRVKGISYSKSQISQSKKKGSSFHKDGTQGILQKKPQSQTSRVQYHHSFSNYLAKKQILKMKHFNLQGKLQYYDLEQIVNKIASPIKLQPKLQAGEGVVQLKQKKSAKMTQYQHFIRQAHYEKNRYNQSDSENQSINLGKYIDIIGESKETKPTRKTLWLRRTPKKSEKHQQNIMPWHEDEDQSSPMKPKNMPPQYRPNPISQDFQSFIL